MRTIVLIPAPGEDEQAVYWKNFIWRVRDVLRRDGLDVRIVVAASQEPQP